MNEDKLEKIKKEAQFIADELFGGDLNRYGHLLQAISLHYGIMELTLIEPMYAAWVHLKEHGFYSQEEIGEVMWNVHNAISKEIWTRVASFPVTEYIFRLNNNKSNG